MKLILAVVLSLHIFSNVHAQNVVGTYEQGSLIAPDAYRDSEHAVTITKDPKASKRIWIEHLIPNQKFYAVLFVKSDDKLVYSVPAQQAGNYLIELGCITMSNDHDEDKPDLAISLNNKSNCFGISQTDYDKPIKIDKNGVSAGGVKIGSNGQIKGGGVDIKKGGISVDTKTIMAGIQYTGNKIGLVKKSEEKE